MLEAEETRGDRESGEGLMADRLDFRAGDGRVRGFLLSINPMKPLLLLPALCLLLGGSLLAADAPPLVKAGFEVYKEKGISEALDVWMKDSPLVSQTTQKAMMQEQLSKIEGVYGKFTSYEEVAVVEPAGRLRRVYGVAYHEKAPIFYSFDLFNNSGDSWVLYFINFDTKIREVFPPALIDRGN